jgi:NAD+ synthase (glutamine-hydrolysing)
MRRGRRPRDIYYLACTAFLEKYAPEKILKWIRVFFRRFFSQQFKVFEVSLSPRNGWKMPSDAVCNEWIEGVNA